MAWHCTEFREAVGRPRSPTPRSWAEPNRGSVQRPQCDSYRLQRSTCLTAWEAPDDDLGVHGSAVDVAQVVQVITRSLLLVGDVARLMRR
jgi:hypothetical protein